ncbi:TonB-dependent siderophore receptor [Acidovorax sp. NCPPB 3576]|uniref:TonB-dependent siderophore receptor n=1 Tax=Acidovorax sp. NCPPB 3576 TaxID=2940488 RepID=UPI00234BD5B3|nr:TonB-dependent receptor [Acidovorax sp. NCPPB 3576]WCM89381.1 TonB-dependent receptor [Acidovorax sp. NCPPB 3576]
MAGRMAGLRTRAGCLALCLLAGAAAAQSPAPAPRAVELPPGPLADRLPALAAQTGASVQADAALLRGLQAPGVAGRFTPAEALARLLAGTGLAAAEEAPGVFVLQPAGAMPAAPAPALPGPDAAVLPVVRVTALREAEGADAALGSGNGRGAGAATRTATPALAVPQALSTLLRPTLDALGATRLDDALDYVPGVSRQNDFGGTWDNIALRGFAGHEDTGMSLLRNGMAGNRGYNAPRDTANVERFEFLRGPVAALYGVSEPGGTLNVVTQPAPWEPLRTLEWSLGRWNARRAVLTLGGPLDAAAGTAPTPGEPARLAYRLTAVAEDKGSFREHVRTRREMLAPALTWRLAEATTLRYDGEWLRQRAPLDRGVVALGGQVGTVPATHFYGDPGDGDLAMVNQTHQWLLDHALANGWRLHAGLMARRGTMEGFTTYGHGYGEALADLDARGWLWRQRRWRDFASSDRSGQLDLQGQWEAGGLRHTLLAGMEVFRFRLSQVMQQSPTSTWQADGIDVRRPVYRDERPATQDFLSTDEHQRGVGLYLQDQIELAPQWKALLGLRHDRFRQAVDDRLAGSTRRQSQGALSPRAGLTWLPVPGWAVYASVGASFRPNVGVDVQGAAFAPEKGLAREIGIKWQPPEGRLSASLAFYGIAKRNVLVTDLQHPDHSVAAARVRSRGAEFELAGRPAAGWSVVAGGAWLQRSLPQFPRASGSLLLVREWALDDSSSSSGGAGGHTVGLGGGLTHVGERTGDAGSPRLPAYTTTRLLAHWQAGPALRLSLQVDNAFDRRYYASAYNSVWVVPGAPRHVTFTAKHTF